MTHVKWHCSHAFSVFSSCAFCLLLQEHRDRLVKWSHLSWHDPSPVPSYGSNLWWRHWFWHESFSSSNVVQSGESHLHELFEFEVSQSAWFRWLSKTASWDQSSVSEDWCRSSEKPNMSTVKSVTTQYSVDIVFVMAPFHKIFTTDTP